jgi:hypothetical protein
VRTKDLVRNRGGAVLHAHGGTLLDVLKAAYPDKVFLPWRFRRTFEYFSDRNHRITYVNWLVKEVGVKTAGELSNTHYLENGGGGLLNRYGNSPLKIIQSLRPEADADVSDEITKTLRFKPRNYWVFPLSNLSCFAYS